jgi:hypothetical protein
MTQIVQRSDFGYAPHISWIELGMHIVDQHPFGCPSKTSASARETQCREPKVLEKSSARRVHLANLPTGDLKPESKNF